MKFISTKGGVDAASFEDTLFSGYAADGGLFLPESIPKLDKTTIDNWKKSKLSYPEVVEKIVRLFVTKEEIPDVDLSTAIATAYGKFDAPEKIGFKELKNSSGKSYVLAEMYHGKTASFKDYAMSLVGQFLEYFSQKRQTRTVVLVGTSGDTGSAAMETVQGLKLVDIVVLYPKGITPVQELQMTSYVADNVHVYAVEGTSDDLDIPIRQSFPRTNVTSINSISWTRVMIQIAHHVYFYLREGEAEEIDVFVPTGGGGNIASGVIARLMGFPINLYSATNANDNVDMFLTKGIYRMGGLVTNTPANAMDIRFPYNIQRILYLFTDAKTIANVTEKDEGIISPETRLKIAEYIKGCFKAETPLIYETMKQCWEQNEYMICPHTATAVAYFNQHSISNPERKTYIVATASPFKFPESSEEAGIPCEKWNGYKLRDSLLTTQKIIPQTMARNEEWFPILQSKIDEILNKGID